MYKPLYFLKGANVTQKVYMYTVTYKTGKINEKYGTLTDRIGCCGGRIWVDEEDKRKYQTNCPLVEGEVRGASIWFLEPNLEAAKKAFAERANIMRRLYFDKFLGAEERSYDGWDTSSNFDGQLLGEVSRI